MINDWPYEAQKYGPCLLRTHNVFDPASWRAWDGRQFSIAFANPYRNFIARPDAHVCEPVLEGEASSLVREETTGIFITSQFTFDDRFGRPGLYLSASGDLIHWSKPHLIAETREFASLEGAGKWSYGYFSLLDPKSFDRNFSTIGKSPYLYYVRLDGQRAPYTRVLFRRKVILETDSKGSHE
jgi:hypothetical protein